MRRHWRFCGKNNQQQLTKTEDEYNVEGTNQIAATKYGYGKITAMMDKTEPPLFSSSRQLRPGALRQNCGKSFLLNYFHLLSVISQLSDCLNRKKGH